LLPALGLSLGANATLWLAIGGFALGAAASEFESKALYVILMLLVVVSSFAVFFGGSLPEGTWIANMISKIATSSSWMTWAIWFGAHLVVAVLLSQWVKDPTLSVAEAIGQTVALVTELVGSVSGAVVGGLFTGIWAAVSDNPWVLVALVGVGYYWLSRKGVVGNGRARDRYADGSLEPRARQPEYQTASLPADPGVPPTITRPEPGSPQDSDPFFNPIRT
jgi:hypothetical protein